MSKSVRGAKAKGSGKTRELETQPCRRIISQKESCHGCSDEEAEEEKDVEKVVTRADLVSEVVPLTS